MVGVTGADRESAGWLRALRAGGAEQDAAEARLHDLLLRVAVSELRRRRPQLDGTVDATTSPDGRYLYVQTGLEGGVDAFRIAPDGSLTAIGSVTVPRAAGIAAT